MRANSRAVPRRSPRPGRACDGRAADYELLIEAIYEGYLLHYHAPRVMRPPEDDLGLLAGDRLYALGLERLVALGDVEAVAELADVITLSALAHGSGEPELAAAVWAAGARAVGWGASRRLTSAPRPSPAPARPRPWRRCSRSPGPEDAHRLFAAGARGSAAPAPR